MQPVRGGASTFVDGVIVPGGPHPTADEQRFERAYGDLIGEIAAGIAEVGHPERHGEAARHDARSVSDVLDDAEAQVGAVPVARRRIESFSQGVLGADPTAVSALFMAQQSLLDGGGGSARVVQGLGTVAARLLDTLTTRATVLLGHRVEHLSWDDTQVEVTAGPATVIARALVLAVPLGALLAIDAHPALPEPWLEAARSLRYGSLTKTSLVAPGVEIPGWAVISELPSGLVWQAQPGLVTTYVGGGRAEALVDRSAPEVIAQAAADVSRIVGREVKPQGVTWRWSPRARRGGCYVVFGPGQVGAHWADLRRSIGPLALAGEHGGTFCGYVEGAMESGVAATTVLLTRTRG
jgi:monoamine oxidase